jgi:hypothetical protein
MGETRTMWYTPVKLSAMRLPNLPQSAKGIRERATREGWEQRRVPGRGGRDGMLVEFQPPPDVQLQIDELANGEVKPAAMVITQESRSEYHGERSTPLLREVVVALDHAIQEHQLSLNIELRADAIAMVYDLCLFTREPVDTVIARVLRLIM